jgi:hypothetical protein
LLTGHRARSEKYRGEGGRFIDRFVGALLLAKFGGFTRKRQTAGTFLCHRLAMKYGADRDPTASFGICFWIDGREQT